MLQPHKEILFDSWISVYRLICKDTQNTVSFFKKISQYNIECGSIAFYQLLI